MDEETIVEKHSIEGPVVVLVYNDEKVKEKAEKDEAVTLAWIDSGQCHVAIKLDQPIHNNYIKKVTHVIADEFDQEYGSPSAGVAYHGSGIDVVTEVKKKLEDAKP